MILRMATGRVFKTLIGATSPLKRRCCWCWHGELSSSTECIQHNTLPNPAANPQPQDYHSRKEAAGLYGYDLLKSAKGFRVFAQEAIERSRELISRINQLPPSMDVIQAMDEISDTVCTVVDAAELCRNTHPDKEFVEEANQASMDMYKFLHYLNTNRPLYNAIVKLEDSDVLTTEEARRATKTLRADFERGGIHLCSDKLERLNEVNLEVTRLGREYGENILRDPGEINIFPSSKFPSNLHHMLSPIYHSNRAVSKRALEAQDVKGWKVVTEPGIMSSILKSVSDSEVRKQVYIVGNTVPKANLEVLDRLIEARHEFSQLLGYTSYAEFATATTMAGSPQVVKAFLVELLSKICTKAEEELMLLKSFKKQKEYADSTFNAWDEAYYISLAKSRVLDLNANVVASYFPLMQCLEGLKFVVKSLFGATFLQVPVAPGEIWNSDVQKWALEHPSEGTLGYMFLDLYARKGKFPNCAHFALRGGRRVSLDKYQLPVVALVCNFSRPSSVVKSVLNHWEVETLFHEFGHALHSLLSRTDYQHFSGTRTLLDFAETPSNLFEYFAWDYRVLKHFAKHHTSGEVIPEKLVDSMNNARKLLAATELRKQVLYALIDQSLFGEQSCPAKDTTTLVSEITNQYSSLKHVKQTHWQTRFSHVVSYGAGYYSYLYARCIAASIWQTICTKDPLSLQTGDTLRQGFLRHGGAKDPSELITDCLGKEALITSNSGGKAPCINQLLSEYGI